MKYLHQDFPKGGKTISDFKICGDKLILDIFKYQMKSKQKVLGLYILVFLNLY